MYDANTFAEICCGRNEIHTLEFGQYNCKLLDDENRLFYFSVNFCHEFLQQQDFCRVYLMRRMCERVLPKCNL